MDNELNPIAGNTLSIYLDKVREHLGEHLARTQGVDPPGYDIWYMLPSYSEGLYMRGEDSIGVQISYHLQHSHINYIVNVVVVDSGEGSSWRLTISDLNRPDKVDIVYYSDGQSIVTAIHKWGGPYGTHMTIGDLYPPMKKYEGCREWQPIDVVGIGLWEESIPCSSLYDALSRLELSKSWVGYADYLSESLKGMSFLCRGIATNIINNYRRVCEELKGEGWDYIPHRNRWTLYPKGPFTYEVEFWNEDLILSTIEAIGKLRGPGGELDSVMITVGLYGEYSPLNMGGRLYNLSQEIITAINDKLSDNSMLRDLEVGDRG